MRNRKLTMAMTAAALAACIGLGSVYGAALTGLHGNGRETETEETETEGTGTEETKTRNETKGDDEWYEDGGSVIEILEDAEEGFSLMDGGSMMMSAADAAYEYESGSFEPYMVSWNTEEYGTVGETGFKDVKLYPFSTFGMDVDTASYALLRRNTLDGTLEWLPRDAVRIEEMINYFTYDYEAPEDGDTFSITAQIADCPWNADTKLMLVGLQARDIPQEAIPDQNLVFLVDTSGSMYDQDKLPLAVKTLKLLLKDLDERDTISIVTYAGSSDIVLEGEHCTEEGKEAVAAALDSLEADGGTWGEGGIRMAYDLAAETFTEGGNNRVLLLTDGDFNLGQTDDSELVKLVEEKAKGQIFLSILGFGSGNYNDALAEQLADKGNGNYSYVDSEMEARRVMGAALKGTLNTVAKDAKIQIDFNPAQVRGYRLVGYENRLMDAEDFDDDTKDGGEVGAGQQVTALYELVMSGSDYEIHSAQSRYTQAEESAGGKDGTEAQEEASAAENESDGEYLTVSIRYKEPDGEESRLQELPVDASAQTAEMSDNMSWAAGVAQAGMLLRQSEFAGSSDPEEIRERLRGLTGGDEYREEFVYLISRFEGAVLAGE